MTTEQGVISISHLGLTKRDLTFISNLFRLGASQLADYQLIPSSHLDRAQVVLINADSPESVAFWTKQGRPQLNCPAVWISSEHTFQQADDSSTLSETDITVARPLVSKKIFTALKNIASPETAPPQKATDNDNAVSVLVVDDSPQIQRYLALKLPQLIDTPLALDFAECGEMALEKTKHTPYDLIFLDVMMPGIDGYKTCKIIKAKANSHVVMLTSNKSPFDRIRGTMSGCNAYLTKPPNDDRLAAVFRKMLAQKGALSETNSHTTLTPTEITGAQGNECT